MKKLLALTLAAGMIAGVASGQTVLSQNAVGYVKVEVDGGKFAIVRSDFTPMSGDAPTPSVVYGDSLPLGTTIFLYNASTLSYQSSTYEIGTDPDTFLPIEQWSDDSLDLSPGRSWWVQPGGTDENVPVIAMGEVPPDSQQAVTILEGFNLVSFPYPADTMWEDTELAQSAEIGDTVYFYDVETENYTSSTYEIGTDPDTFLPIEQWSVPNLVVTPGVGFWYQAGTGRVVDENRPYLWPNDNE